MKKSSVLFWRHSAANVHTRMWTRLQLLHAASTAWYIPQVEHEEDAGVRLSPLKLLFLVLLLLLLLRHKPKENMWGLEWWRGMILEVGTRPGVVVGKSNHRSKKNFGIHTNGEWSEISCGLKIWTPLFLHGGGLQANPTPEQDYITVPGIPGSLKQLHWSFDWRCEDQRWAAVCQCCSKGTIFIYLLHLKLEANVALKAWGPRSQPWTTSWAISPKYWGTNVMKFTFGQWLLPRKAQ